MFWESRIHNPDFGRNESRSKHIFMQLDQYN